MDEGTDPREIRSIAVSVEDVVAALEYNRQRGGGATLRVTPPFHGRMRARIHAGDESGPGPIEVAPERLIDGARAPAYPRADETEAALRDDPDAEYSIEAHYERHEAALDAWREAVADAIVDQVTLETPSGEHAVDVKRID